jgi:predicted O-methyltransferase YrrM
VRLRERAPVRWFEHAVGRRDADSQVTPAERACLARHAAGRRRLVEIGVMQGATTSLLRSVMDSRGTVTGIDPHPAGRLGLSFERLIALREVGRFRCGRAVLLRKLSHEAAADWTEPIDFLFIDGDHSWAGIQRDWTDWSRFLVSGGIVALHDSRSVPSRPDLDSVRFTEEVILWDKRFRPVECVESLTILERVPEPSGA